MFGLINKFTVAPGVRDDVIQTILAGANELPGCQSYFVAADASDGGVVWVTEVWDSSALHAASLDIEAVATTVPKLASTRG